MEGWEVDVVDQVYIGFGSGFDDVVFQVMYGFQVQWDYYEVDDVFVGYFVLFDYDWFEYFVGLWIGDFFWFVVFVGFVGVEVFVVFLVQVVGFVYYVDGGFVFDCYVVWEVFGYDVVVMVVGVDVDYVGQVGWVYGLVEFFYYFVDVYEVDVEVQQFGEVVEVWEQYMVDQEVGVIVDYDWVFVYFFGVGDGGGDGGFIGFFVMDYFYQWYYVYWVEEMYVVEVFWMFQCLGQQVDGDG